MSRTGAHLGKTCLRVCAKPTTLLAAFAAGGLIGLASTRVERSTDQSASHEGATTGSSRTVLTSLGAMALHLSTRYLAQRAGEAALSGVRESREAAPGAEDQG
jgi:hypothetical protein